MNAIGNVDAGLIDPPSSATLYLLDSNGDVVYVNPTNGFIYRYNRGGLVGTINAGLTNPSPSTEICLDTNGDILFRNPTNGYVYRYDRAFDSTPFWAVPAESFALEANGDVVFLQAGGILSYLQGRTGSDRMLLTGIASMAVAVDGTIHLTAIATVTVSDPGGTYTRCVQRGQRAGRIECLLRLARRFRRSWGRSPDKALAVLRTGR